MTKAVFGLANNQEQASRIVDHLLSSGFSNGDISILYPEQHNDSLRTNARADAEYDEATERNLRRNTLHTEKHSKAPEGAATGATTGGILGGSLGLLAGIGALAIPGLGPFIAAGPIMAALSGSAVGGSLGLLIGAIVGSGIPEYEAKKYEAGLKQGNILISVHTDDDEELNRATEVMKKEGAKEISSSTEKSKSGY